MYKKVYPDGKLKYKKIIWISMQVSHRAMRLQLMPKWKPCKCRVFIKKLLKLGFNAPEPGGRHFYMRYGPRDITTPSNDEYSVPQLKMMIKELEKLIGKTITLKEWEEL